jgi:hypothetical protein
MLVRALPEGDINIPIVVASFLAVALQLAAAGIIKEGTKRPVEV